MLVKFETLNNYFKISGYALSFTVGTPINAFIIYRLLSKDVAKSYYYRLLIFMCSIDIYQAVFGEGDYWADKMVSYSSTYSFIYGI